MRLISGLVSERYWKRYCTSCEKKTRQRYLVMHPRWALFMTLISCGLFLPIILLMHFGYNQVTRCERCGATNAIPIPYRTRDTSNQYAGGVERGPKRHRSSDSE